MGLTNCKPIAAETDDVDLLSAFIDALDSDPEDDTNEKSDVQLKDVEPGTNAASSATQSPTSNKSSEVLY